MQRHLIQLSFIMAILSCMHSYVHAQSKIRGSVASGNNQPLEAATVLLLNSKDSSLVKGTLTAAGGRFTFDKLSSGNYLVSASYSGYKEVYSPVVVLNDNEEKELATLGVSERNTTLSGVTVVAKKPFFEQKIDRLVINVAANITSAGSTVLDVLERSPGIVVDRQNNALSINGKGGVNVMINGRLNNMPVSSLVQMLAGMPADNVERVELITTPPANFDAEGNAGYINIVLKRNLQYGTNGSYALTAGYSKGWITTASGNINYRQARWNLYANYSFNRRASNQTAKFYHAVTYQGRFIENYSRSEREPVEPISDLKIGADYYLKKDVILGSLVSIYDRGWKMDANNFSSILVNQQLDTITKVFNHETHPMNSIDANLNLQKTYKKGSLTINADYMNYREKNPVTYTDSYFDANGILLNRYEVASNKNTPIRLWVGTVDLERTLSAKVNMSAGLKTTISRFTNAVEVSRQMQNGWEKDPELTATSFLKENISAGYTSFNWDLTSRTKMKMGLRFEYTNSNLSTTTEKNIVDRHYGRLFPSFFFSHAPNDDQTLGFSYSRRITRPTFWNLAPFVIFMDPNTFFSGNPGLQPSITDNLNLSYTFKRKIVSFSYSYDSRPITNFSPHLDPKTNKETLSAENQKDSKSLNLSFSMPMDITKWWSFQVNLNGSFMEMNGLYNNASVKLKHASFSGNAIQNLKLPRDFTISISSFYSSPQLFGIYKANAIGSVDLGVQKKFANKKSSLRLNYSNIFNTIKFHFGVNLPENNLIASGDILFTHPGVRLTFTHSFGSEKVKSKRERLTGSEEEKDRLKM